MKKITAIILFLIPVFLQAQDGSIIEKKIFTVHDSVWTRLKTRDAALAQKIRDSVDLYRITYMSDGLKVTAYMAEPKAPGKYPCIISNRGGNRDF